MTKSLEISIQNVNLKVVGDAEQINKAVLLVNEKITDIKESIPIQEKLALTALNIAEMKISNDEQHNQTLSEIVSEINNITAHIEAYIN